MKKLLGTTLALAMLLPAGANAELLKNLKVGGQIDINSLAGNNVKDFSSVQYDHLGYTQTRVMINTDWDLLDDVHSHVTLRKNNRTWGSNGTSTGENLTTVQTNIIVDESYIKIDKLFGALDATLGRQFYGEPGDIVIWYGPKQKYYGLPVTAIDAGRFDWNGEKWGITALGGKITGAAIGTVAAVNTDASDVNLWGLQVHAKPMDSLSGSAYVYNKESKLSTAGGIQTGNDKLYVAGVRAKVTAGGAWVKGEFDKNFGTNRSGSGNFNTVGNYTGSAIFVDGGVKADVGSIGSLTGWGQYGIGSGDGNIAASGARNHAWTPIAAGYRPASIWGRFFAQSPNGTTPGANSSLTNLQVIGVGGKINPAAVSKLTVGVSVWNFRNQSLVEAQADAASTYSQALFSPNAAGGSKITSKFLGNEYDLDAVWQHSENVSLSAGVGRFMPGGFFKDVERTQNPGNAVSPVSIAYADWMIKW